MNFDLRVAEIEKRQKELAALVLATKAAVKEARRFTAHFLNECAKAGITKVAIARAHKSVPSSVDFPFGPRNSVFSDDVRKDDWPAIWSVVSDCGLSGGCGNHNQHSLNEEGEAKLIDGVYHLKNGKWKAVD